MYDTNNRESKKRKISKVLEKIRNVIGQNKELGVPEDLIMRQNVSKCFIIDYLREENIEFENTDEVNQVVEDLRVELSAEVIRYKPKGVINQLPHCDYDPKKINR